MAEEGLIMGEYEDYMMTETGNGEAVAGVCHARGSNDYLPPQWLMYVLVPNLDESIEACRQLGGKLIGKKGKWVRITTVLSRIRREHM